jgi:hypothetical protein
VTAVVIIKRNFKGSARTAVRLRLPSDPAYLWACANFGKPGYVEYQTLIENGIVYDGSWTAEVHYALQPGSVWSSANLRREIVFAFKNEADAALFKLHWS